MRVFGVVTEFNPFHNGHAYLLQKARERGADFTVCVMSGDFVQRGEPAVCSKWQRARAAALCGADLVIELPVSFAVSSAERFARGAVYLLSSLGICDNLVFGTEEAEAAEIMKAASLIRSEDFEEETAKELKKGVSYPKARQSAAKKLFGDEIAEILGSPNQVLALEYCRALIDFSSDITPISVRREGAGHDSCEKTESFASASLLREMMGKNVEALSPFMPRESFEILKEESEGGKIADFSRLEMPCLSYFRRSGTEEIANLPDVSEGLENRIKSAAGSANSLKELIDSVKTKRYTHARLRRIALSAYLGLTKDAPLLPEYIRVLALGKGGRELLREMRKKAKLPVIMKYSDASELNDSGKAMFEAENLASDLYGLLLPQIRQCGDNQTHNLFITDK